MKSTENTLKIRLKTKVSEALDPGAYHTGHMTPVGAIGRQIIGRLCNWSTTDDNWTKKINFN